jgi:hypothetical protein
MSFVFNKLKSLLANCWFRYSLFQLYLKQLLYLYPEVWEAKFPHPLYNYESALCYWVYLRMRAIAWYTHEIMCTTSVHSVTEGVAWILSDVTVNLKTWVSSVDNFEIIFQDLT